MTLSIPKTFDNLPNFEEGYPEFDVNKFIATKRYANDSGDNMITSNAKIAMIALNNQIKKLDNFDFNVQKQVLYESTLFAITRALLANEILSTTMETQSNVDVDEQKKMAIDQLGMADFYFKLLVDDKIFYKFTDSFLSDYDVNKNKNQQIQVETF